MGSGSSTQQQQQGTQVQTSSPWSVQTPYLKSAFADAQNQYNQNMAQGPYSGNYVAPTNQNEYNAANNQYATAMGSSTDANNGVMGTGSSLIPGGLQSTYGAANGLNNFSNSDQTGNNINSAQRYASGFNVPGQVQGAMQQGLQTAADSTLPSLYRGAAAGGNINSDRTAVSDGVVRQGLAQQAAGLTASLNNSNYQNGLGQASNDNAQKLQGLSQLGSLGSNMTQQGTNDLSTGINNQGSINNQANAGSQGTQALDQSNLNNTMDQYNGNQNFGWSQLQNLMGIVGGKSWGGTTVGNTSSNSTTQQDPSLMSSIGSLLGAAGSAGKLVSPKG